MKNSIVIMAITLAFVVGTAFTFTQQESKKKEPCKMPAKKIATAQVSTLTNIGTFSYTNFSYDVGTRFYYNISKTQLQKAKSLYDFLPRAETGEIIECRGVKLILLKNDKQTNYIESGENAQLTEKQIDFLKDLDYSDNFLVKAYVSRQKFVDGEIENTQITPHLTVTPEKQAEYIPGKLALLEYIKDKNLANTINLNERLLRPAKIYFTVSTQGTITNVTLDGSCGFEEIDAHILKLFKTLPGTWQPAENANGEKVAQELVFSYGLVGC